VFTTYTVLQTVHIVAVATWLGGGSMTTMLSSRARREQDPVRLVALLRTIEPIAKVVFPASGLVLVLTGFGMIADGDLDYETWIILGIVAWAYSFLIGGGVIGPTVGKAIQRFDEAGPTDQDGTALVNRFLWFARVDALVLSLVVADMVMKPGS
jgi:uncharacterized membrane protein